MATKKITCTCCGKSKAQEDFYTSRSYINKHTGRSSLCKECIWDYVTTEDNGYDYNKMLDMLQMIDRPFIQDLLTSSIDEAAKGNKNVFKIYMKNLGMVQNIDKRWQDSDFKGYVKPSGDETEVNPESLEIVRKWGRGYTESDIEYLENFYNEYKNTYATDTPVQVNLYKNIAKIHLQAEKELAENSTKNFKDLMELSSKLHNDGNIKPIQSTGANDDKGLSTYGLWIKTIAQDEPCEYFENKPLYEDYDKLKKYWEDWFVRPFKNIFNLSKDFNVRDDD